MLLRVVVLTTYFDPVIGGVESNAARLARFLGRTGCGVHVVTKRITPDLPAVEHREGFAVHRVGPYGQRSPGGKWTFLPAATSWLIRNARRYDVVCAIDFRAIGCAALAARTVTGRPVVFQAQTMGVLTGDNADAALQRLGVSHRRWLGRALKSAITRIYRRADAFACIARAIEAETVAAGLPPERVRFIPNPIDMRVFTAPSPDERAAAREALGLSPDRAVCAYVGRLSREKGILDLLEAWAQMTAALRSEGAVRSLPVLLIAGPDMPQHRWDAGAEARALARRYGLGDTIRFLGPIQHVPAVFHAADCAVVPSHFEALGLTAIEALACGLPVIASSAGGLLEVVRDDHNGLLCPPRAPVALAGCLRLLLLDEALRMRLGRNARPSVREYDEDVVFRRFHDLLSGLVAPEPQPVHA